MQINLFELSCCSCYVWVIGKNCLWCSRTSNISNGVQLNVSSILSTYFTFYRYGSYFKLWDAKGANIEIFIKHSMTCANCWTVNPITGSPQVSHVYLHPKKNYSTYYITLFGAQIFNNVLGFIINERISFVWLSKRTISYDR